MKTTVLERLLITERLPRRADESTGAGFAVPALQERPVDSDVGPLLVTNMRGTFVPTVVSKQRGVARYALDECSPADEPALLREMIRVLHTLSDQNRWGNRCANLAQAAGLMKAQGFEPRTVVVPYALLESIGEGLNPKDADDLMTAQGYVVLVEGVQVLAADIPPGKALVAAAPALSGFYTRSDNHLGIMLTRVNRAFYIVNGLA